MLAKLGKQRSCKHIQWQSKGKRWAFVSTATNVMYQGVYWLSEQPSAVKGLRYWRVSAAVLCSWMRSCTRVWKFLSDCRWLHIVASGTKSAFVNAVMDSMTSWVACHQLNEGFAPNWLGGYVANVWSLACSLLRHTYLYSRIIWLRQDLFPRSMEGGGEHKRAFSAILWESSY